MYLKLPLVATTALLVVMASRACDTQPSPETQKPYQGHVTIETRYGTLEQTDQTVKIEPKSSSAWHVIAASGHVPAAEQWLLKNGAKALAARNNEGLTPLHVAGSMEMAKWLLAQKSVQDDYEIWQPKQYTPLHHAAANNRCGVLEVFLNHAKFKRSDYLDMKDGLGKTPLHYTIGNESRRDCGVNIFGDNHACLSAAKLLVGFGADKDLADHEGKTCAQHAQVMGVDVAKLYGAALGKKDPFTATTATSSTGAACRQRTAYGANRHTTQTKRTWWTWRSIVPRCVTSWNIWQKARSLFSWRW